MTARRLRAGFMAAGAWLLGALLAGCGDTGPERDSVDVAVAVPFAGSGLMAEAEQAWTLVVDHVNASGGVAGKSLRVHQRDTPLTDSSDLAPVGAGVVDLAAEGYKYIISLVSGAAAAPIIDTALPQGVLAMSITSEERAEDLPPSDGMLLRGILPTDRLIAIQARELQAAGLVSIAIVGETRAGATDPRQLAMTEAYAQCATCALSSVTFAVEADLYRYDWTGLGEQVVAGRPDVVFLASAIPAALIDAVYAMDQSGYRGLYYFAYGALMTMVRAGLSNPEIATRFRSHDLALPPSPHLDRFLSLYEDAYGAAFVPEPRLIAFADYLALLSLAVAQVGDGSPERVAAAMKQIAGPPGEAFGALDYAAAVSALEQGRDIDFMGLSGPLDFDERGEVSEGFVVEYGIDAAGEVVAIR